MRIRPYLMLAKRVFDANVRRPGFPFKLTFVTTYWCNYKCKTCNIWQKKPKDELSAEEVDRFFKKSNRFSWIDITGGEVSLRQDFPQLCESAVKHNKDLLLLHFPTNGYLTDRIVEQTRQVMALRPTKLIITVSLDGDEMLNDEIRGVKGGFLRQVETFRRLRGLGADVVFGMTLSKWNADKYEQTFEAVQRHVPGLTLQRFHINIVHESSHYLSNDKDQLRDHDPQTTELLVNQVESHWRKRCKTPFHPVEYLEKAYLTRVRQYLETGTTPMRCHALRSSCFVDSWGTVYPCTIYNRPLGSLRETNYDLRPIWDAAETRQVQEEIWENSCPQCWTPCEAYPSIMGNFLRVENLGWGRKKPAPATAEVG